MKSSLLRGTKKGGGFNKRTLLAGGEEDDPGAVVFDENLGGGKGGGPGGEKEMKFPAKGGVVLEHAGLDLQGGFSFKKKKTPRLERRRDRGKKVPRLAC